MNDFDFMMQMDFQNQMEINRMNQAHENDRAKLTINSIWEHVKRFWR